MPDTLIRTSLSATLLAVDEFLADLDTTGCDAPYAVCTQHILTILIDHAASLRHLLALRMTQQALAISDDQYDILSTLLAHIAEIHASSSDDGCDPPYTVVNMGARTQLISLRERIGSDLAGWKRDSAATKAGMRAALERSSVAHDDWLNTYAPEFCDESRVTEARDRIHAHGGTLAYIADVQEQIRQALSHSNH